MVCSDCISLEKLENILRYWLNLQGRHAFGGKNQVHSITDLEERNPLLCLFGKNCLNENALQFGHLVNKLCLAYIVM